MHVSEDVDIVLTSRFPEFKM